MVNKSWKEDGEEEVMTSSAERVKSSKIIIKQLDQAKRKEDYV